MKSKRFSLNKKELKKFAKNTAVFFAPAFLIFLLSIQSGKTVEESMLAIYVWVLSTSIDLTKKFIAESK